MTISSSSSSSSSQSQRRGLRDDAKKREGCGVAGGSLCLIADPVVTVLGGVPARSVQIRRSLCIAGGRAANHALARRSSSWALHGCVSYLDDAGVISMLHSVVLAGTAAAAGSVWRGR